MRVVLERSNLLKSLGHVHRVVERRNTIPILSNVLLSADAGTITDLSSRGGPFLNSVEVDFELLTGDARISVDTKRTIVCGGA